MPWKQEIILLDIEVSFNNADEGDNRIDILLYNIPEKTLRFYEAKDFKNPELKGTGGRDVVDQVARYRSQLARSNSRDHILEQYGNQVEIMNELFGTDLPKPKKIDPEPRLYLFGFDRAQKNGKQWQEITKRLVDKGLLVYAKGNPGEVKPESIWELSL